MASVLNELYFHDEQAAFRALEAIVWPEGKPTCPHCGAVDRINRLASQKTKPSKKHPEGKPVYQHCKERHLHRYLAEFDFRYNNRVKLGVDDTARTAKALRGIVGKRLTYRDSSAGRA
jgi:hypothetical protein